MVDCDELVFENAVPVYLSRLSTSLGRNQLGTYILRTGVPNSRRKLNFGKLRKVIHTTFTVKANVAHKLQITNVGFGEGIGSSRIMSEFDCTSLATIVD